MAKDKNLTEYEKALRFLETGCGSGCSANVPKEEFSELRESFQALTKPEQDIFLMAQLKSMDGGAVNISRRLKSKTRTNKRTIYCWDRNTSICQKTYLNMLGIGRSYFESIREHLVKNGLLSSVMPEVRQDNTDYQPSDWTDIDDVTKQSQRTPTKRKRKLPFRFRNYVRNG